MLESLSLSSPFISGALFVVVAALLGWIVHLELRLRRFMQGQNGVSLEGTMKHITKEHAQMLEADVRLNKTSQELRRLLTNTIRGVAVIRFNAVTGDSSGKQSFATALISESGNGVVISSLYTRDNVRVYAKPVQNFSSEHELTDEEKQAIIQARKSL